MMQKHTGGVRGTVMFRGYCPYCGRGVAGANVERGMQRGKRISLRPHKRLLVNELARREWCPGGRSIVDTDLDLMAAWAKQLREAP